MTRLKAGSAVLPAHDRIAPRRTCLYVSPHLDDAAFSCAGGMLARAARGDRVVVCTVFSRSPSSVARKREDRRALARVGAEGVYLDFEDAPGREAIPATFRTLILDATVKPALVDAVGIALAEVVARVRPDELWLPLAVGGHVDHRTVFAAGARLRLAARYYEDRPYAFVPALRRLRRLELEGGRLRRGPGVHTLERQFRRGGCGALLSPNEAGVCLENLAARLCRPHGGEHVRWRESQRRYPLAGSMEVITCYTSQVRWLLGDAPVTRAWSRAVGGPYREREVRLEAPGA